MALKGKTVTGGTHGLGRLYCESLAQEGANVVAICFQINEVPWRMSRSIRGEA